MDTPKSRKRRTILIATKKAIIDASESGKSNADLSKQFRDEKGDLPLDTIKTILKPKSKQAILSAVDDGIEAKRARTTTARNSDLEEALLSWLKIVRSQNIPVTGPLLKVSFTVKYSLNSKFLGESIEISQRTQNRRFQGE